MEDTLKKEVLNGSERLYRTARFRRQRGDLQLSSLTEPGNNFAWAADYFLKPATPRPATSRQSGHFNFG